MINWSLRYGRMAPSVLRMPCFIASNILQRHLDIFVNFGQLPEEIEEEPEMTKEEVALYEKLSLPISELELSVRSSNCLREANIKTIADLVKRRRR